ncbi:hypothetical protein CDAR_77041 [Caerostris darwini]|uniref:Uncharacterized protein n=1 Tax=Caerostris darwini TaxID=1538125 RepID=A0AAV4R8X0_9ARAC|nr:hypothetical protein CDAR_77041 [Caerostris darwini]
MQYMIPLIHYYLYYFVIKSICIHSKTHCPNKWQTHSAIGPLIWRISVSQSPHHSADMSLPLQTSTHCEPSFGLPCIMKQGAARVTNGCALFLCTPKPAPGTPRGEGLSAQYEYCVCVIHWCAEDKLNN